jgi:hypothetical protein
MLKGGSSGGGGLWLGRGRCGSGGVGGRDWSGGVLLWRASLLCRRVVLLGVVG